MTAETAATSGTADANVTAGGAMRKTQSDNQLHPVDKPAKQGAPDAAKEGAENDDGYLSDSALHGQPRERKKGERPTSTLIFISPLPMISLKTKRKAGHRCFRVLEVNAVTPRIGAFVRRDCLTQARPVPSLCVRRVCAGVPWTEEAHRLFLLGLEKLGKVGNLLAVILLLRQKRIARCRL